MRITDQPSTAARIFIAFTERDRIIWGYGTTRDEAVAEGEGFRKDWNQSGWGRKSTSRMVAVPAESRVIKAVDDRGGDGVGDGRMTERERGQQRILAAMKIYGLTGHAVNDIWVCEFDGEVEVQSVRPPLCPECGAAMLQVLVQGEPIVLS